MGLRNSTGKLQVDPRVDPKQILQLCFFLIKGEQLFSGGHSDLYPNLPFMPGGINPMPGAAPAPGMPRPRFDPFGPLPDMNQMPGPSRRGRRSGRHPNFPPSFF